MSGRNHHRHTLLADPLRGRIMRRMAEDHVSAEGSGNSSLDHVVSWLSFLVLMATAAGFAWYVPANRAAMMQIYRDFHLNLPRSTAITCAVPTGAIIAAAALCTGIAFLIQLRSRSKRSASLFHLMLTVAVGVVFLAYREAMGNAIVTLVQGMSGSSAVR